MPKVISAAAKLLFWECWNSGIVNDGPIVRHF